MKISRFVTLVLSAASLIVAGVYFSQQGLSVSPDGVSSDETLLRNHSFLPANHPVSTRIDCFTKTKSGPSQPWPNEIPPCRLVEGWTPTASGGAWVTAAVSRFEVVLEEAATHTLVIRARVNRELPPDQEWSVRVAANGNDLGESPVSRDWADLRFQLPEEVVHTGSNSIVLSFDSIVPPVVVAERAPTVEVRQLTLIAPTDQKSGGIGTRSTAEVWNEQRRSLIIDQPGTVILPVLIPSGTEHMELGFGASMGVDLSEIRAHLAIEDLDGEAASRLEIRFPPEHRSTTVRLPVGDLSGRWAMVTIGTSIEAGVLEISKMRFVPDGRKVDQIAGSPPPDNPQAQPDIILITLDAARADRFSYAGHNRETTPFIDSLAEDSLVFSSAFSLVPYTVASVPTMITGLSFLDHGVVGHDDVLSREAVTLAESLHDAGYLTAAFSATPNNSRAKGFDQGYDVFREVWTEGPNRAENRRARFIAQRVVEWLRDLEDDSQPLHLQVHMVPPHAPFAPPPSFDRFSDSSYDGPCDGNRQSNSAINNGSIAPTRECLDHLLDLYDGNLLSADHAVRTIVKTLRNQRRWHNTVLLITSDHGEAFGEHGWVGHNRTLYSEMMHVPFVLRMPSGHEQSTINTEQMVTLADITPTLLRAAGVEPPQTPDGVDLLSPKSTSDGRFLVSQTAAFLPERGIRTLRWSLMVDGSGTAALFDLANDPHEAVNILSDHPSRFVGLGRVLATRFAKTPQLVVADETADITEEERELLETLGYIRD